MDKNKLFVFSLAIVFLMGGIIQSQLLLNVDVSWLLEATKRLLAGGTYTCDFFENNPPLILYLYIPTLLINKYFFLSLLTAFRLYVFTLALLSLFLCWPFIRNIFSEKPRVFQGFFLLMIAAIFLVFPMRDFGQREHLLVIFSMPYFFLLAARIDHHFVKPALSFWTGCFAGIGFAIKPFFLPCFFMLEAYYFYRERTFSFRARRELQIILMIFVSYFCLIGLKHPDYWTTVLPFASHWQFLSVGVPFLVAAFFVPAIFCYLGLLFFYTQKEICREKTFLHALAIGIIGFLLSYLMQASLYLYHLLPALSLTILLNVLVFYSRLKSISFSVRTYLSLILLAILIWIGLGTSIASLWNAVETQPVIFYCFYLGFFSILYFLYFSISSKKIIDIFLLVSLGYAMAYLGKHTWFSHSFLFTNACLLLGFSLLISGNVLTKLKYFLITLIGMYFFMFSFNLMAESFYRNKAVAEMKNSFMDFLSQYPKTKSVYFFATDIQMAAQTLSYFPSMKFASRFSFFWMLPGMIKQPFLLKNHPYLEQDKNFLIKMIAEDLIRNKPGLIFIDKKQQKNQLYLVNLSHYCSVNVKPISFDYLSYFSQNKLFQTAWKPYHYIMTIKKEGLFGPSYEFAVYAR